MTAREVLQRLADACVAWDGTSTIDGGEDERQEYFESRDEAVAYLAQPEPQDDARDAARYRWLVDKCHLHVRDIYSAWSPYLNDTLDVAIDADIAAQDKEQR